MTYQSIFKPDSFEGQTVIVTGGGSGIGRCIAHELASLKAHTVLVGRNESKLSNVLTEIKEDGGDASFHICDIREEQRVSEVVSLILKEHGQIHGLVNNAGGQFPAPIVKLSRKGFEAVIQTNLTGGFLFAREVYKQSMQKTGGSIVNIIADMFNGMPGMAHSGAARAGMENFTKSAAIEWGTSAVRVNAVAPGFIASSGLDTYDEAFQKVIPGLIRTVPLSRLATEAEVAAPVVFLLSQGSAFISGATLRVDGGASLGSPMWPLQKAERKNEYQGFHRYQKPKVLEGLE